MQMKLRPKSILAHRVIKLGERLCRDDVYGSATNAQRDAQHASVDENRFRNKFRETVEDPYLRAVEPLGVGTGFVHGAVRTTRDPVSLDSTLLKSNEVQTCGREDLIQFTGSGGDASAN